MEDFLYSGKMKNATKRDEMFCIDSLFSHRTVVFGDFLQEVTVSETYWVLYWTKVLASVLIACAMTSVSDCPNAERLLVRILLHPVLLCVC